MQCLNWLFAPDTAIEQVPDSIGLLSRLQGLLLNDCKNLKCVPGSIWNLTSIDDLGLHLGETVISLPDSVKNMKKLSRLDLSGNVRVWVPVIQCLSSLIWLKLSDEGRILPLEKPFSLLQLYNLQVLILDKCTSLGCSLPQLPLNLERLRIYNHTSLEQLPDISSLKKLVHLGISGCISLQSILLLPCYLESLCITECTSLQELPDLSVLKELEVLEIRSTNLKSISLKQGSLHVGQSRPPFRADLPNREIAEWFTYKTSGRAISFDIPPSFGSNFSGLALWIVYTCKSKEDLIYMRSVIAKEAEGVTEKYPIYVQNVVGEAQSTVKCITGGKLLMKSGERIKVSFPSLLYTDYDDGEVPIGEVKVKMCGVHVIRRLN
ncbi:hypothetical protein AgCh_011213 [Apium graveolens]